MMDEKALLKLIVDARDGDKGAWEALCNHYYPRWLRQFHGRLGSELREMCDTEDLVHSALADALKDIGTLRNAAAFYSWVSAIVRRKMAEKRRDAERIRTSRVQAEVIPDRASANPELRMASRDDYVRVLDTILTLFRSYPEPMAAVYLKYFEGLDVRGLMSAFGKSERATYRLLETALSLIRSKVVPS